VNNLCFSQAIIKSAKRYSFPWHN